MIIKPDRYKVLHEKITCLESLKSKVDSLSKEDWLEFIERKVFPDQKNSLTIPIFNKRDKESLVFFNDIVNTKILQFLNLELKEIDSLIKLIYNDYCVRRSMLVMLPAGCSIDEHVDQGYHLFNTRRIHVPIITNDNVIFYIKYKQVTMTEGSIIEINNNTPHSVKNLSKKERVHLILDYGLVNDPYYNH